MATRSGSDNPRTKSVWVLEQVMPSGIPDTFPLVITFQNQMDSFIDIILGESRNRMGDTHRGRGSVHVH